MLQASEAGTFVNLPRTEPDQDLVAAVKDGDTHAFEALVAKYQKRICRIAYRITLNQEDAEDVAQWVFCKVFLKLNSFEGRSTFFTWLTRITVNESLMHRRRREAALLSLDTPIETQNGKIEAIDVPDRRLDPEQAHSFDELQRFLGSAVKRLHRSLRVVFVMHLEGYSGKETAEALGVSLESVKTRLFRARAALRSQLNRFLSAKPADEEIPARRRPVKRKPLRSQCPSMTHGVISQEAAMQS